jgi:hypothetical protein
MIEIKKTPNKSKSNSGFEDFPDFRFIGLLGCFGFRASNFGFSFVGEENSRDKNLLGDLPAMQRRILLSLPRTSPQKDPAPLSLLQPSVFGRGERENCRMTIKVAQHAFRF